ncbi:hypothetical protein GWI33_014893 [Rhynchophorus ferrugineus]|uniref:C2H2-type domain-containing protein n=1 Tax=Rhynchophorus ferrugineus TaxID=354439 RepID=A0A834I3N3_RHYFE|nr:hypothetical protein GWI33_014893 [Rhynchophorus ferrugineus]
MDVMFSTGLTNELTGTEPENTWTIQLICPQEDLDTTFLNEKSIVYTIENDALQPSEIQDVQTDNLKDQEKVESVQIELFICSKCQKSYNAKRNLQRHLKMECGKEPQYCCNYCDYKNYRRNEIANHVRKKHSGKTKTFQVRSQKDFERRSTLSSGYFTCHQTETERKSSYSSKIPDAKSTKVSDFGSVPSHKYEDRPYSGSRDCNQKKAGLLTDSLSCIFTRRPKRNNQHRAPQKRVFFEEVRAALASPAIDTNDCPLPPTISKEENPNWTPVDICPEPPLISNKSVGQEVSMKESNVSPYVPKNMFELDEYSKYKTQQLGKESKYKQMTGEASGRYQHQDDDVLDDTREDYDEELSKYDIASYAITSTKDVGNHYQYDYKQSYYDATSYGNNKYTDRELENICPEAPNISGNSQLEEEEDEETAPEPPKISSTQLYPGGASNVQDAQRKCHKCSFQTGNPKRLKDHLKFVHGETTDMDVDGQPKKTNELFSRREPKPTDTSGELFSRRGYTNKPDFSRRENVPPPEDGGKKFPGTFKRRNTSVNIISSNVLVPAHKEPDNGQKPIDSQYENQDPPSGKRQDSGVLAAMEYFENSKDQVKKPRPYKRNADELLDDKWF